MKATLKSSGGARCVCRHQWNVFHLNSVHLKVASFSDAYAIPDSHG